MGPLEYAEYKNVVEVLEKSDAENTYQILMEKENKVLDTVNNVIKYYKDNEIKEDEFINMPLSFLAEDFFNTWKSIFNEIMNSKNIYGDIYKIINKENRIFNIGIMCILISLMMFFVKNS